MGLFRKSTGATDTAAFSALMSEHLGPAELKRRLLEEVVGDLDWELDLDTGTATFHAHLAPGEDPAHADHGVRVPVQVLGSWSKEGRWIWAWADTDRRIPPALLRAAERVRQQAGGPELSVFVQPEALVDKKAALRLSLVASSLAGGFPVYQGEYEGGVVYFMVGGMLLPVPKMDEVTAAIQQTVAESNVDHKACVKSVLAAANLPMHEDAFGGLVFGHRDEMRAAFDAHGHLAGVGSTMGNARA